MKEKIQSIRVYITENCNANCTNCFNASVRNGSEMSIGDFEKLCIYLSANGITLLKIMGGEPTVHSNFEKIIEIAQKYIREISIFTNGLNLNLKNIHLREKDTVIYNFKFYEKFSSEALGLSYNGDRLFQVQILSSSDEVKLVQQIMQLASLDKEKISFCISLDCMCNIFRERESLVKKLLYIEKRLTQNKIEFSYDHKIPKCFLYETGLKSGNDGICDVSISGVIGADFTLRFCNNFPSKIITIYKSGQFVPWNVVENSLFQRFYNSRLEALNKICSGCSLFNNTCNGGCWTPKEIVKKEDIIQVMKKISFSYFDYSDFLMESGCASN